ncbi:hypothetical protein [Nocardia rhizosphaerae]|uniref:Uncharacterized protein n=1 Tax=Nocardia rhizosphaerae TaxID=1691571 RepID=A0ABV8L974_9NOCA
MSSRILRTFGVTTVAVAAIALNAGAATAAAPAATPVVGSVEVCLPIPVGPIELSFCL